MVKFKKVILVTSYVSIHRTYIAYRYVCSGVQQLSTHLRQQKSLKKTFTAKNVKLLVLYPIHNVQKSKLIILIMLIKSRTSVWTGCDIHNIHGCQRAVVRVGRDTGVHNNS